MKKDLVEQFSHTFAVPPETIASIPVIHLHGGYSIVIENHCGMIAYAPNSVCVKTKTGMLRIDGERLCISCMSKKVLELRGIIAKLELL